MIPELHDYQKVGVDYLRSAERRGLFLDMGLGKTCIALTALEPRHLPALVIAPKRVVTEVWPSETPLWRPDLTVVTATGSPAQRKKALESDADIVVIGRDVQHDAEPYAKKFKTMIIDELSGYKTKTSNRWRSANRLQKVIPYVWGLTGTPSPNGLLDLWGEIYILDRGARLGKTLGAYRQRYFDPGKMIWSPAARRQVVTEWVPKPGAEKRIHTLLESLCLAMQTDGRIDLPDFTVNQVKVPLPPRAAKIYRDMERDLVAKLDLIGTVFTAANAAVLSSKLSQITAGFLYNDDQIQDPGHEWIHDGKIDALAEIIEATDTPVLVAYRYKAEREAILKRFKNAHTVNEPNIQARWNNDEIPLLVTHPASAGHGLNLQKGSGHTMVWTSQTWNLEEWDQFNKRLHRQGQKRAVVAHVLYSPGTVDTAVYSRLVDKKSVQDALMDYLEAPL